MARFGDDWLNGESGLANSLRTNEAVLWEQSAWTDMSARWDAFWSVREYALSTETHLTPVLSKTSALAAQWAADGSNGGGGNPLGAPSGGGDGDPQFLGDAIGDNISSTATIAVGGTLSSLIDHNGDVDYIRISLVAGQTYTFSLYGGTLSDPYLELRDAGGAIINDGVDTDDGGIGLNSFMMYTATSTADYWIVARHWNAASGTGTYTLDVNAIQTGNTSPTTLWDNGEGLPHYSWDEAAIQITRSGSSWASSFNTPTIVTYAYRSSAPTTMPDDTGGFSRFNAAQVTAAEATLAAWAAVANITFQRVDQGDGYSNNASILFGNYSTGAAGAAAFAYLPSSGNTAATNVQGDVWTNSTLAYNSNPILGEYGYQVLLHEIGHALGLSHPAEYNAAEGVSITYQNDAVYYEDSRVFTVMSYFGSLASNTGDLLLLASLPQMHDIAAIQRLYGADLTTRTGDTVYGYNSNTGVAEYMLTSTNQASLFAIWDGGGNDTLDLSGYTTASTIDLRQEAYSSAGPGNSGVADFNISIARGAVIENAIGGNGADTIIGNSANNVLNGGAGADTMTGNDGNDTYIVDNASDVVTESLNQGTDAVQASINYTLTANVENLTLTGAAITGTGNAANDVITGNSANNTLSGGDGADTLDGGGGNDIMAGGNQNDTYYVDSVSDVITETGGGGLADIVFASVSYTLAANVDNLTLIGTALNATGNSGNNILTGNAQNNILDGAGGIDDFFGGAGDDSYIVDGQDTVTEAAGEGADTVLSGGGAWTLGANFENITITNTGNSNAFGNELNNVLIGASGSNTLDGGLGADTMTGGLGDDRYYVDNAGDAVTELASEGDDWVFSTISYTLGANLERIILTGSANINATGNSGDNFVQGNTGANVLAGGLGVDTVYGDSGDDIINYTIGDGPDTLDGGGDFDTLNINDGAASSTLNVTLTGFLITSAAGATITQIDAVNANMGGGANSLTYNTTTALTVNLATAVATGFASIAGFVNVTGGSGDDLITGDAGNNTLNGGDGADTLVGGLGIDAINGGNGNDIINWAWGDGNGAIDGGGDFNTFNITGNASANILKVNLNGSTLIAAAGNTLNLIQAVNAAMGGGGDLLEYNAASTAATVNLTAGTASGFASISGIANATGGGGNDNLTGDATANKLLGGDGDDTLVGLDGVDTLIGGNGADTFYGGLGNDGITCDAGNDIVFWNWGDGGDTVNGGADFDTMTFIGTVDSNLFKIAFDGVKVTSIMGNPMSNIEAVVVNTGGGGDWLIYKSATTAITVNLATGVASGLTSFSGVSHVQGGTGDDIFTGDAAFNKLDGGDGNDTLSGGGDNDVLTGGNGNDTLTGGTGLDTISGGEGNDTIYWAWNDGGDSVDGGNGTDAITFTGDSAVNLIKASWNGTALTQVMSCTLTSVETVNAVGGGGADWLIYTATAGVTASLATNTASGFASIAGFANLQGGAGNDSLTGDGASNKITGGDGDDTITGLGGGDTLTGGLGNDTFVYAAGAGSDTIADFDANATGGQDLLDITGFGITAGDFGARVSIVDAGNQTIVTIDGSVVITLTGVDGNGANIITQADFLLGP